MRNYSKTPTIFQMEATECGAASLAMIFAFFGQYVPLEQMRVETGVSRDGCNAGNIMRAAKKYGLECHGYQKEPEELLELDMPCLIHWNFNHFVVLEGFKGKYVILNDPAVGRRKLTMEEFDDCFTGIVLTFKKTDKFKTQKRKNTLPDFVYRHLKHQGAAVFQLLYIGILLVLPGLILPILSQVFIDDVLCKQYTDWLVKIIVFMGACVAYKALLSVYRGLLLQKLKSKLTLESNRKLYAHLIKLPMSFYDQRYAGDLVSRMQNNSDVNSFLAGDLAETMLNILTAVFYLFIMLMYSPLMTAIGVFQVSVSIVIVIVSNRFISEFTQKMQITGGKLYGAVCAGIGITDTLKASGAENRYSARILGYQANNIEQEQKLAGFQQLVGAIPSGLEAVCNILLLMTGSILVIQGNITMGMLVAFNSMFGEFCHPVDALVGFIRGIQTLKSNINRVEDIEKHPVDDRYEDADSKKITVSKLAGEIELKDISFGYSRLKPALVEDFNFRLGCGQTIAFVGASGCGKSTVSKIVSGLYKPWGGSVLFDSMPFDEIPKEIVNSSVATVSQKITLFSGSVRDNITMWNKAVLEEDMIAAAKDACIHDHIMQLPGGYDFRLTENASNFSGGQRQRLEIARALATKPTILIMDEATSALDPIVEKQIMDNIRRRGCTCVIVAHRLSAVRDCTQIVVMKSGKIIQRGTHEELVSQDGYYRRFIQNS